jgi:hypothetical protein
MDSELKTTLKSVILELRHLLEGGFDPSGEWKPGNLEQRLAAIGVRRERPSVPLDELPHSSPEDRQARGVVDAYLALREEAGIGRDAALAEFVRESAYTWANRLLALRCMEARELIESVILQQEAYGGRSLEHHRLARRHPELCAGADDGLFALLERVFRAQAQRLPILFDPQAPGIALRPAPAALKDCVGLLSLQTGTLEKYGIRLSEENGSSVLSEPQDPFTAPDALGWAYQYWNSEEKGRVFERVRRVPGAKIAGTDIIPATQSYTEDELVKFLVQNSLGAIWMGMYPRSKLCENWEYYVRDADRAPVEKKPVREIAFLDPACGSGHFLLEAFDLLHAMYEEEARKENQPVCHEEICDSILTNNLFGIDIDARGVQIAEAALWMKAAERAFDYAGAATNLVAATASHLKGAAWEEYLAHFKDEPSVPRVLQECAQAMEHIAELGSLARPDEVLRENIRHEHAAWERQVRERKEASFLFPELREEAAHSPAPFQEISDRQFARQLCGRARHALDEFTRAAHEREKCDGRLLASEARAGFRLMDLLFRRYDVIAADPPYLGRKNMGPVLKQWLQRRLKPGQRDLYAAFLLRSLELAADGGRVAMVTQQSWMLQRSFSDQWALESGNGERLPAGSLRGLLRDATIEALAHPGECGFDESSAAGAPVSLFVVAATELAAEHRPAEFRLIGPKAPGEKGTLLREAVERPG